jgi:glycosyltransferase involved in cell wall biosynthesis
MPKEPFPLLIATGLYPPDIGGPATYCRMLEELLPQHGIAVTVLPFGEVRSLPKVIRHFWYAYLLFRMSKNAAVIYALDPVSVGLPARIVALLRRKPLWVRLGGDYAWEQGQQRFGLKENLDEYTKDRSRAPFPVKTLHALQRFVTRGAEQVIAPSEYLKSVIVSWGVDVKRVAVIYSALHPLPVSESKAILRERLSFTGTVIASVGRLVPWKGFAALIDAVADLTEEYPGISLIIIGDGPEEAVLRERIAARGMGERVRLMGKLPKDALGDALKASDIFVLNTSYEGLSHQLLEAMEIGVPVVTTSIGGNPELIRDGVSGFLVTPNDTAALREAIMRLIQNEDLRTRMVQNARVRTLDFAEEKVVSQFAALLLGTYENT